MPHNGGSNRVHGADRPEVLPLAIIGCDAFECALLPLVRELMETCRDPRTHSWSPVYSAAAARWGAQTGLPLAYGLARISEALMRVRGDRLQMLAADPAHETEVTRDERLLLLLLHQLRRNHVAAGQDFLLDLTEGEMDRDLLACAQEFAQRHSCGTPREIGHDGPIGQRLRLV